MARTRNMDWYHGMTPHQKALYNGRVYRLRQTRLVMKKPDAVIEAEKEVARACGAFTSQQNRLAGKGLNQAQHFERMRPQIQRKAAAFDARDKARSDWAAEKELLGLMR